MLQLKRNQLHLKENHFLPKSNVKQLVSLNQRFTAYKRKLIKIAKWILEISPKFHISFLLCANKYTKPDIQLIHFLSFLQNLYAFQESNKSLLKTFLFHLNVPSISIAFQVTIRKAINLWILPLIFKWKTENKSNYFTKTTS